MIITCESKTRMCYIYLQPYIKNKSVYDLYKVHLNNNGLKKYVDLQTLKIPIFNSSMYQAALTQMKVCEKTYRDASIYAKDFGEEYQNDLDESGYMVGIELNLSKDNFLDLIGHSAFQIYKFNWLNKDFIILTLDKSENVFNLNNKIYPFTDKKDAFAIVHIENKYHIGLIKGIISAREDIYPTEYLCKPDFILWD